MHVQGNTYPPPTLRPRARRRVIRLLIAATIAIAGVTACSTGQGTPGSETLSSVVDTTTGPVRGTVTSEHRAFQGIPYAAAPTGELRWKPPAAHARWTEILDATAPGLQCAQSDLTGTGPINGSEDCLFLNVWAPAGRPAEGLPVMVWIHGGAFVAGASDLYDPSRLVQAGNMIVVTINYRLGALGSLAHPSLAYDGNQVGNFGLLDQQAALRWVRDNITAFGGNPGRVTLAGESAGAGSTCLQLASPAAAGLFHAAIMQSATCSFPANEAAAVESGEAFASTLGCTGDAGSPTVADCLRNLPSDKILYATRTTRFPPVIGSTLIPIDPATAIRTSTTPKMPMLMGTTHDEYTFMLASMPAAQQNLTADQYTGILGQSFGTNATRVAEHYPLDRYSQPALAFAAAMTDHLFACPNAEAIASLKDTQPVYAYEFDDRHAANPDGFDPPFPMGAGHTMELPYLFDATGWSSPADGAQRTLSAEMINYWARFVNAADPNDPARPTWPPNTNNEVLALRPAASTVITDFFAEHRCGFWASITS